MGGTPDSHAPKRRIDGAVKVLFVEALRAGASRDAAAARAGFSSQAFYAARKRDPLFKSAWVWALALCAADEREARHVAALATARDGAVRPNNLRPLQRREKRHTEFTDARKQVFLDHFAGTADVQAACGAAGVHYSTVYNHRRTDPVFAAGWDDALALAYALLEAEAVRQRLAMQQRAAFEPRPSGAMAREFERVMALLGRWDRRGGAVGARRIQPGGERRWSFDEAIEALDKKLRALGVRRGVLPAPDEEEGK